LPNVFGVRAPQDEAFETRARAFEVCRTSSACALLRMRTSIASFTAHDFKQPISFSRRVGVRGLRLLLRSPERGWAERRETFGCSAEHPCGVHITRHARRLARRLAFHDAGRSPLGAPPCGFGLRGRASLTGICAGSVTASSSHPGRSAWRAGSRASRDERLQAAAAAGRHASLRIQVRSRERALNERGWDWV